MTVRRLVAALAMVALSVVVLGGRPPPAEAMPSTSQIQLTSQTTWVGDNGTFHMGFGVTTPDPADAVVQVSVFHALSDRSDFIASLSGQINTTALKVFDPIPLSALEPSPQVSIAVNPRSSVHTPLFVNPPVSGVYPVTIDLYDGSGNLLTQMTTHLVYTGPDAASFMRLDVAWVVPFHAAPATGSDPNPLGVAGNPADLLSLTSALVATPDVALTVVATPQTVDGLANGTPGERATVAQLAQSLSLGNRQLVATPYVDLDLPAMLDAGLDGEVSAQLTAGTDVLAGDLHAVASNDTWVETGPLTPAAVDDLAGRGVRQLVVANQSLTPLPAEDTLRTPAQPFTVAGKTSRLSGAAVDAELASHFEGTSDEVLAAHQLLADLAMVELELPNRRGGRGVVIVPPADWQPNAAFLATFLEGLATAPMLAPVTVDQLFSGVTPFEAGSNPLVREIAPVAEQPRGQTIGDPAAIRAARQPVASLAAIVPSTTSAIADIERRILVSESADLPYRAQSAELAPAITLINQLKALVRLPGNQSITLTARQGLIPITVLSSAPYPVKVMVQVSSQKLGFRSVRLSSGTCTQSATSASCIVELTSQNTTLRVPVVAKTSGVFSLTVSLDSPDGGVTLATNQDTVRSTAASEVGVLLSIGAALLLAVWWVRDVVHGRRARRLMPKPFDLPGLWEPTIVGGSVGGSVGNGERGVRAQPRFVAPAPSAPAKVVPIAAGLPGSARSTYAVTARSPLAPVAPTRGPRPRPASWDDQSGLATQPIPIIPPDLGSETPHLPAHRRVRSAPRPPPPTALQGAAGAPTALAGEGPPQDGAAAFSRNTSVMAAGTLLSRLTGFGRVLALIWAFGIASGLTDVYTLANTAPNILYDLVLGGVLSATLVPVFVDYLGRDDPEAARRAISAVVTAITVTLLALSALFWLATPAIIRFYQLLAPAADVANERAVGTTLLHMFVPQLFLLGGIAVTTALLNARRRFAAAAFSPVLNNLVAIGAIVGSRVIATNLTLPGFRADQSALLLLGLGTTAGYLFQFLAQVPPLFRAGFRLRPVWDLRHPAVRTVLRLSLWTFGAVIANQVSFNLILVLADHKVGDVAVFSTAYQFFQLPYAIFAVSIASVITPDLSEQWAKRDLDGFRRQMASGFRLTMAVLVPAAVGYVVLAEPFLQLVLRHGSFSSSDSHRVAVVVIAFALGLPGFSAYLLLMRGYQSMQDTKSMFWLYLAENIATVVLAAALYPLMGVSGLALGWVGAYTIGAIAAFAHLRRRTLGLDGRAIAGGLVRVAGATALMAIPVIALTHLITGDTDLARLEQVGGGVVAGTIVYLAAVQVFGISELTTLLPRRRPS